MGNEGQVIVDVIPEVELFIGKCEVLPVLPAIESRNRFHRVFGKFIGVFARKDHPLALFLDDPQWVDQASLDLIGNLFKNRDTGYLYLIGAYRDNEVNSSHPLLMTLDEILETNSDRIRSLVLSPLSQNDVNEMVAETTGQGMDKSRELAQLIVQKTGGNPFFIIEFVKYLYQDHLFQYDANAMAWVWNMVEIRNRGVTEGIAELMIGALAKLSPEAREILKIASCIGTRFDLRVLGEIWKRSHESLMRYIEEAIRSGLLLPGDNDALSLFEDSDESNLQSISFHNGSARIDTGIATTRIEISFLHDRVQEAAYMLNSEKDKKENHLSIGRILYEMSGEEGLFDQLFDIVGQWNAGLDLVVDDDEELRIHCVDPYPAPLFQQ